MSSKGNMYIIAFPGPITIKFWIHTFRRTGNIYSHTHTHTNKGNIFSVSLPLKKSTFIVQDRAFDTTTTNSLSKL